MTRFRLLLGSALLGMSAAFAGVLCLLLHLAPLSAAYSLLGVGFVASLLFMGGSLVEILTSRRAPGSSKVAWSALIMLGGTLGGLLYLLIGRRDVAEVA